MYPVPAFRGIETTHGSHLTTSETCEQVPGLNPLIGSIRGTRRAVEAGAGGQANGLAFARAVRLFFDGKVVMAAGVSDGAGIHMTCISDLERDARNPTISVVEKLAQALDVSAGELLD